MTVVVPAEESDYQRSLSLRDDLLRRRYVRKDEAGRAVETPEQMFARVAEAVAGVDARYGASREATASVTDVENVFRMAFDLGCKGITVYRDGARTGQTLTAAKAERSPDPTGTSTPRARTRVTCGRTSKFRMGCGTLYVTVNQDEEGLCEVFANLGKAGGCPSQSEATCRAISIALRSGVDPRKLIEQLRGIRCLSTATARNREANIDVLSCPDAIGRALEETGGEATGIQSPDVHSGRPCPFCGYHMRREAGCFVCDQCLHNSCG